MIQQIVNGLISGSIYALFAVGMTLVFGVLDRLNLAHPSVFAASAFLGIEVTTSFNLPVWAAVPVVLLFGAALGAVIERVAFRPIKDRHDAHFAGLISSIALGGMIVALLQFRYGTNTQRLPVEAVPDGRFELIGAEITFVQAAIFILSVALVILLTLLVNKTRMGRSMRAVAEDEIAARVAGINVNGTTMSTFVISSALGGLAGLLFAINVNSALLGMGTAIELKALAIIIMGGLGSLSGALIGGLLLGLAEVMTIQFLGSSWRDFVAFALLFTILIVRPSGLIGRTKVRVV